MARDAATGEILGCANRSVRDLYVNGAPRPVGYMSQLRVHPGMRRGLGLAKGLARAFELLRRLHDDGRAPFYLMSLVADNHPARRLLTGDLRGFPRLHPYAGLVTYALRVGRPRSPLPLPRGLRLARGSEERRPDILACLGRNAGRRQLAPCWTAQTLCRPEGTPGLAAEDFFTVLDGERVVGCLAAWDQSAVKQTVVRGYAGALARWRKLLNLAAPLGGWPELPDPGSELRSCYASHRAVDGDDPAVFAALLRALYNHAAERRFRYLAIGLAEADPWRAVLRAYRSVRYRSQLYLAAWEDGEAAVANIVANLDGRLAGPEVAVL